MLPEEFELFLLFQITAKLASSQDNSAMTLPKAINLLVVKYLTRMKLPAEALIRYLKGIEERIEFPHTMFSRGGWRQVWLTDLERPGKNKSSGFQVGFGNIDPMTIESYNNQFSGKNYRIELDEYPEGPPKLRVLDITNAECSLEYIEITDVLLCKKIVNQFLAIICNAPDFKNRSIKNCNPILYTWGLKQPIEAVVPLSLTHKEESGASSDVKSRLDCK